MWSLSCYGVILDEFMPVLRKGLNWSCVGNEVVIRVTEWRFVAFLKERLGARIFMRLIIIIIIMFMTV